MSTDAALSISVFGTCAVRVTGGAVGEIRGVKHRALLAILATAPLGRRTRTYLQTTLWGAADYESGHQNLRRALSDLRKQLGPAFDALLTATNADVELDLSRVSFAGGPGEGPFLDDLNLPQPGFRDWVAAMRADPSAVAALHAALPASAAPPRAMRRRARPRVTVLAPAVLGDDPVLHTLADWMAEHCCRTLSRSSLIAVISHLSSRAMTKRRIVVSEVRDALEVDYIVTGALTRLGGGVACDLDLIETGTGEILWTRRVAAPDADDLPALLDRVAEVARSVAKGVADAAVRATRGVAVAAVADHDLTVAGVTMMHRRTLRDFLSSREYLAEAVRRNPNSPEPAAWLGKWYILNVYEGFSTDRARDTQKALDCTARALDADPENGFALTIDGFALNHLRKDASLGRDRFDAALAANPNESLAWLLRGSMHAFADEGEAALEATREARRLSPVDPFGYFYDSLASTAHLAAGNYHEALEFTRRSLAVNDRHLSTHRAHITALHHSGQREEARAAAEALRERSPDFNLAAYRREHPIGERRLGGIVIEALAASGIE